VVLIVPSKLARGNGIEAVPALGDVYSLNAYHRRRDDSETDFS
jgi:hypothetical protein